ncbi:MAG: cadherin repeat domain-containing protein, partial [Candidatus Aenigmarchaeota archaeon]|nr:cadherin repeat domain-containing protein [Candidatus Aenigmarchaeota archaeon]
VLNINDAPNMTFICNNYSVQELEYYCNIGENTTDPDNFSSYVPYTDTVNGTLTYEINFTYCNKTFNATDTNCTIFGIDNSTGIINYTDPQRKDSGNYTINITAKDGGNLTSSTIFNFTVVPDYAPVISPAPDQSAVQNGSIYLSLNATDLDNATDNLTFRTETYYEGALQDTTLFAIVTNRSSWPPGPAYGIMNYTPVLNSHVGNYTVKVIVNDTWGRENYTLVDFNISNINDDPVINFSCLSSVNEDTEYFCNISQNTTDIDTETPYGENLTYTLNFNTGFSYFLINQTTGIINFTAPNDTWANNTYNFTYNLTACVTDSNGSVDCDNMSITIHAVNDAPVFSFSNTSVTANTTFFENISAETTDEENDVPLFYNLTFVNCSKENVSDTNCTVFDINTSTGVINFYAPEKDIGNYTLNVTVTDSGNTTQPNNATSNSLITFRILTLNHVPFVSIAGTVEGDTVDENESITFLIAVSDSDGQDLQCTWYRNETEIGTINSCQNYNSWEYTPGFEESGVWDFKLSATDSYATSSSTIQMTIVNKNRPPALIYPIQNQSWNMNTVNKNIVLSYNFQDPDNENNVTNDDNNLTINYTTPANVAVLIDEQTGTRTLNASQWSGSGAVSLTPTTDWYGLDYIIFTVTDSEFNVSTNNITLNVSQTDVPTETVIQQVYSSGGSIGSEAKIASLTLTTSPIEMIGSYNTTTTVVTLKNTGEVSLNVINITAYVNETDEVGLELSRIYISQLATGANATTNLTINTEQLTEDMYEIKVTGSVGDPKFNQSTSIYLRTIHGSTKVMDRINLAKDLFQDNPECLDLTELILEAEKKLGENNLQEARVLTETALENCRDIIEYVNSTKRKVTPEPVVLPINEIIIALLSIALGTILFYLWMENRNEIAAGRRKKK